MRRYARWVYVYCTHEPNSSNLLVKDHVHAVRFDVDCVLAHKVQDVFDAGGVRQTPQTHAVSDVTGRGQEGRRGENGQGHHGWRRQRGDQRCGHVTIQDLPNTRSCNVLMRKKETITACTGQSGNYSSCWWWLFWVVLVLVVVMTSVVEKLGKQLLSVGFASNVTSVNHKQFGHNSG